MTIQRTETPGIDENSGCYGLFSLLGVLGKCCIRYVLLCCPLPEGTRLGKVCTCCFRKFHCVAQFFEAPFVPFFCFVLHSRVFRLPKCMLLSIPFSCSAVSPRHLVTSPTFRLLCLTCPAFACVACARVSLFRVTLYLLCVHLVRCVGFVADPSPKFLVLYSPDLSLYPFEAHVYISTRCVRKCFATCTRFNPHMDLFPVSVPDCLLPVPWLRAHIHVRVCARLLVASPASFSGDVRVCMYTLETLDASLVIFNDFVGV